MKINIKGQSGEKAKIAMKAIPENGTTIVQGIAPNAVIFRPTLAFTEVGVFPCEIEYHFMFHRRPWNIELEFEIGIKFSTSNKEIGLSDKDIITPDILNINVNYTIQ